MTRQQVEVIQEQTLAMLHQIVSKGTPTDTQAMIANQMLTNALLCELILERKPLLNDNSVVQPKSN